MAFVGHAVWPRCSRVASRRPALCARRFAYMCSGPSEGPQHTRVVSRKQVLRGLLFAWVVGLGGSARESLAEEEESSFPWKKEDLCLTCQGTGTVMCDFCRGSGAFQVQDSVVDYATPCPNCQGRGSLVCTSCIGLGLSSNLIKGILRDGQNDGRLRVRPNGSIEILRRSAFPSTYEG
ncbi:Protein EMBRYO SAC DEVELOPMENT ARREST 3, chloroplastic [Porphyridium purpureum]|uniref:Protein EMBRYO SAC DEVELOPMENT ARREST 3, chloroplastic n=1 Tax=Porphyridium purpureum TaxID=35688 RepID=A0A5J4YZY0_PORPP|nr:Protein EMBRYO SAC DEVELOPMENT ARREST 3, chloroplastic [Porphyridium purpureum]|eukprot:POR2692..scf208_2